MIKILMITLPMIFLSISCKTKIICNQVNSARIENMRLCDLSLQFNRCRCRCFNINEFKTVEDAACGEDFQGGNHPIDYCEGISGFFVEDWAKEMKPKVKKLSNIRKDWCE